MVTITIRDIEVAQPDSRYIVLVTSGATAYSAYETIEEFMHEWHDTLSAMQLNCLSFTGQKALVLTSDWEVKTASEYTKGFDAMQGKVRNLELLSNGSKQRGAVLVDKANRQTTFFRLNPNDKEYKR